MRTGEGQTQWTDYRGHRRVDVTDGSGDTVKHFFYTGMFEDRAGWSDARDLGVANPSAAGVRVSDPWGNSRENREALAGMSLGEAVTRGSQYLTTGAMWYEVAEESFDRGLDDPDYEVAHRLVSEDAFSQVTLGESSFATRTRVFTQFDSLGRPVREADYGQTRANGSETATYPDDDRVTYTTYPSSLPGRSDPWLVDIPRVVKTFTGNWANGTVLSNVRMSYDPAGRVTEVSSMRDNASSDRQRVTYAYNSAGQLLRATSLGDNSTSSDNQRPVEVHDDVDVIGRPDVRRLAFNCVQEHHLITYQESVVAENRSELDERNPRVCLTDCEGRELNDQLSHAPGPDFPPPPNGGHHLSPSGRARLRPRVQPAALSIFKDSSSHGRWLASADSSWVVRLPGDRP